MGVGDDRGSDGGVYKSATTICTHSLRILNPQTISVILEAFDVRAPLQQTITMCTKKGESGAKSGYSIKKGQ